LLIFFLISVLGVEESGWSRKYIENMWLYVKGWRVKVDDGNIDLLKQ
jgi:hypothetical protein